jgi:hypothetical protein
MFHGLQKQREEAKFRTSDLESSRLTVFPSAHQKMNEEDKEDGKTLTIL